MQLVSLSVRMVPGTRVIEIDFAVYAPAMRCPVLTSSILLPVLKVELQYGTDHSTVPTSINSTSLHYVATGTGREYTSTELFRQRY
eukprot:2948425-Rhodomonas_salina.1